MYKTLLSSIIIYNNTLYCNSFVRIRKSLFPRKLIFAASMEVIFVRFRLNLFAVMAKFAFYSQKRSFSFLRHFLMVLRHTLPGYSVRRLNLFHWPNSFVAYIIIYRYARGQTILGRSVAPGTKKFFGSYHSSLTVIVNCPMKCKHPQLAVNRLIQRVWSGVVKS